MDQIWLAGGLEHDFSPYIGNSNPNWRTHIFHVYFFYLISKAMKPIYQVHHPVLLP